MWRLGDLLEKSLILIFLLQTKFIDIEDELKVVGQNQQTLEVQYLFKPWKKKDIWRFYPAGQWGKESGEGGETTEADKGESYFTWLNIN